MNSRTASIGLLASVFLAVTACSTAVGGKPVPVAGTGSSSPATAEAASPRLEDADPCGLLTRQDVERTVDRLADEPVRNDLGTARGCEYNVSGRPLSVDIRTNVGLAGVNPTGPVTDQTVGGREAKAWVSPYGDCFFVVGVTASSRVDVVLKARTGEDACALARRLAELLEPRLP